MGAEYGDSTDKAELTKSWKLNRKYHVALSYAWDDKGVYNVCAYIDGKRLHCKELDLNFQELEDGIENFYIGSPDNSQRGMEGYITVPNVMLYNRKLSDDEIMTLSRGKYMIDERTMTISPSATLSLTPSLSLVPSAKVPKSQSPGCFSSVRGTNRQRPNN
ncbi:hypothetical protein [Streptomyces hygroscopicus]|uniref:hypothetical protein n=1 Tax=Streptomyces hygroscopicus TaxID=1912 RepID=UPI003F19E523